jgi:hypothetical protein
MTRRPSLVGSAALIADTTCAAEPIVPAAQQKTLEAIKRLEG